MKAISKVKFIDWMFPRICCICRLESNSNIELCELCKNSLPIIKDRCYQCGLLLEAEEEHIRCNLCKDEPPFFDFMYCAYPYTFPIDKLILDLKFSNQLINAKILSILLRQAIEDWYKNKNLPQAIIPVPLHIKRLKQRGYNQVTEILRPIAKGLKLYMDLKLCSRTIFTTPQASLGKQKRKDNLKNAFKVKKQAAYQHVAIVDDVVTTSSTAAALAAKLKNSGIARVDVWCLARA